MNSLRRVVNDDDSLLSSLRRPRPMLPLLRIFQAIVMRYQSFRMARAVARWTPASAGVTKEGGRGIISRPPKILRYGFSGALLTPVGTTAVHAQDPDKQ